MAMTINCPECGEPLQPIVRLDDGVEVWGCAVHGVYHFGPKIGVTQGLPQDRLRQLSNAFQAAHKQGMDALASGDYDALGKAVDRESQILTEQAEIIAAKRDDESSG